MKKHRCNPRLNKRLVDTCDGYRVYSVNPFAIRNVAQPDEEFSNFAIREDFPDLIPDGEIWISQQHMAEEGRFFIANALARLKAQARGASETKAYEVGLNAEGKLRAQRSGVKYRAGKPYKRTQGTMISKATSKVLP